MQCIQHLQYIPFWHLEMCANSTQREILKIFYQQLVVSLISFSVRQLNKAHEDC